MVNVELSESIFSSMKLGYKIPSKDLQAIGIETEEEFYDTYKKDIETIAQDPEEPETLDYLNDNFRVLHSVVGDLQADDGVNVGWLTYHLVDIGVPNKLLGIILDVTLVPTDDLFTDDSIAEHIYVTVLSKSAYTEYLMVVEDESCIS